MTIENKAVTTPVLIVQKVMIFKTVSVLVEQRFSQVIRILEYDETERTNILFETCATGTQEKNHGRTYDKVCRGLTCEPREHKPCIFLHEDGEYKGPVPVNGVHITEYERENCRCHECIGTDAATEIAKG